MHSRRRFLSGLAGAGVAAAAGCISELDGLGGGASPAYAGWLHDPTAVLPVERHVVATVDVASLRDQRASLPSTARDWLSRGDRMARSVSVADVDRVTAVAYGDTAVGSAGLTFAAAGTFDVAAVRRESGVDDSDLVSDAGSQEGFSLLSYEPSTFADLREFRGPGQSTPPDLTFGLGLTDEALVGGVILSPTARGIDAVKAAIAARAGPAPGLASRRPTADLLAVVGDRTLAGTLSAATVDDLAGRVADEATRSLLRDAEALGFGYAADAETLRVALAADPASLADPDRLGTAVEEALADDGPDGPSVERVGATRGGRVVYADLAVSRERVVDGARNVSVDRPLEAGGN